MGMGRLLLCVVAPVVCATGLARSAELVVQAGFTEERVGLALEVAHDPTGNLTEAEVRGGAVAWETSKKSVPGFGLTHGTMWARFRVVDRREPPAPLVLATPSAVIDRITVCDNAGEGPLCQEAGDHVPRASWPRPTLHGVFPLPAARHHELLVRVEDAHLELPLDLRSAPRADADALSQVALAAGYYGLAFGLVAYNLLLWAVTRARAYGLYVAYAVALILAIAALDGTGSAVLWRDSSAFGDHLGVVMPVLASGSFLFFFRALVVEIDRLPRLHRRVGILGWGVLVASIGATLPWPFPIGTAAAAIAVSMGVAATTGARLAASGSRAARLFLFAFAVPMIAGFHSALNVAGLAPTAVPPGTELKLASALELVLFAFALADRIKQLQSRVVAEAEAAHAASEHARELEALALDEARLHEAELARLDAAKTEFLTNLSHELRTPVHGVLGLADTLARSAGRSTAVEELAPALRGAAEELDELIEGLGLFVRGTSRGAVGMASAVEVAPLVAEVVRRLEAKVQPGVALRVDTAHGLSAVEADAEALSRVLRELIGNALKFTSKGSVEVRATATEEAVLFEVEDTGCGISEAARARLFEPFTQGDGSITRTAGGLGLGLALARRLASAFGATVSIEGVEGAGTTARVVWPRAVARAPERRAPHAASMHLAIGGAKGVTNQPPYEPQASPPAAALSVPRARRGSAIAEPHAPSAVPSGRIALVAGENLRLLLVDDDPRNLILLRAFLEEIEATCVEAPDGETALRLFDSAGPFDAVLLDVMMPRMSGYEVCRALREKFVSSEVPVVLLTAKTSAADIVEGFAAGATDYVCKPFRKEELVARVRGHAEGAQVTRLLGRFIPHAALELLGCRTLADVRLGVSTERELAVLFADVRDFTAFAEHKRPDEVFARLNTLFGAVAPVVRAHGGFVDKYLGDSVMALFPGGGPSALAAAVAMQEVLHTTPGLASVRLAIGVASGRVSLGALGEPARFDLTALSDTVNLASRLEGATRQLGVGILTTAESAGSFARPGVTLRPLGDVIVKGRKAASSLVEVLALNGEDGGAMRARSAPSLERALEAFARGAYQAAASDLRTVVDQNPSDGPALRYLMECELRLADAIHAGPLRLESK